MKVGVVDTDVHVWSHLKEKWAWAVDNGFSVFVIKTQ